MVLETYLSEMLPAVEDELRRVLDRAVSADMPELREMLAYHLGWAGENAGAESRGKRIRPLVVLMCCIAAGGDWRKALPAAAAVELLHNFSLIHDDIQDQSPLRRGRPAVWVRWGIPQAINAGDTMYTMAYLAVACLSETTTLPLAFQALGLLQQACLSLTAGQYLDIDYESRLEIGIKDYWPMVTGKTAALLAACAELGSLVAGANESTQTAFQQFGQYLGLAFQVQDDYLGLWGDSALTGKSAESDLVSGKKTLPVLYGLSLGGEFARRWSAGKILPEEASSIAAMLAREGALEYTRETTNRLTQLALEALQIATCDTHGADALVELARQLMIRPS
ncbi:MAG: polyprenyl synthetase family protein [Anaerolineaceae bacterium]|nr:polyprenyl synthetase family protein [Anaerolineaceae bacterium]